MNYFATQYTIHFDDTMAYGSHHFLTSFKFQCFSRESFLFGEQVFDVAGVREALDGIHLLTSDAYSRNLSAARLGDRVAILLTLEEWHKASARFCYRVLDVDGRPVCAGFQTLICADAKTGQPIQMPAPLYNAMESLRSIEEPIADKSFRDRALAGGSQIESLFGPHEQQAAIQFLAERNPSPHVISVELPQERQKSSVEASPVSTNTQETWVFAGQGAFDAAMFNQRLNLFSRTSPSAEHDLRRCREIVADYFGQSSRDLLSGNIDDCVAAIESVPGLSQVAIHLQNVLGAELRHSQGHRPAMLTGHSFGEIAAFAAAGCFDLPTGVRVVCERVMAIEQFAPADGGLLAVITDRQTVATEARLAHLNDLVIAGRNFDRQTIVSGPRPQLEQLQQVMQALEISSIEVPSPTSFHHPCLREASLAWLEQISKLPLQSPTISLYSPNGRRFVAQNDDVAVLLASQLLKPFDLQGGIADLLDAGTTNFVDCGSTGSLAKIISKAAPAGVKIDCLHSSTSFDTSGGQPLREMLENDTIASIDKPLPAKSNGNHLQEQSSQKTASATTSIAVVATGCVLPGGVTSPEELFQAIIEQRTGIVDQSNLDPNWEHDFYSQDLAPDRSTSLLGGCVQNETIKAPPEVDAEVFRQFSRTQKLLCMALAPCVDALKDAERVLCFVGATADGFEDQDIFSSLHYAGISPTPEEIAERIASVRLKFQEPHEAVQEVFDHLVGFSLEVVLLDAACASSLYSVALGMQALEANLADAVIAGGVFCPGPGNSCLFSQFRGSTSTGLRPFDATADGVVFSEGAAVITLRRAADAKRLGMPSLALLRGVGLSSDGRSSSANVPQTRGQLLALQRCYADYGISRDSVDAVEAHGTSTPVGDATEVETLREFFAGHTKKPLPIHSLKGLLGHAGWAAGTASIVAVCEYLRNLTFPAQANFRQPSTALDEAQGTLEVLSQHQPFDNACPRVAIDGFGFGGANAHVVLDHPNRSDSNALARPASSSRPDSKGNELVFVAAHEIETSSQHVDNQRFDRNNLSFPEGHFVLPDLADDMDHSQKLSVLLVDGILSQLPQIDEPLRQEVGVLLAQSGKSERGVEATFRVLAQRLQRELSDRPEMVTAIQSAYTSARPSGPYTLQGMMPNVAAGRATLQFNMNGPNFVVDAGTQSLEASLEAARLLLAGGSAGGTKLVIVAAINANPWRLPLGDNAAPEDESAIAIAVTTRAFAEQTGLKVLATAEDSMQTCCRGKESQVQRTSQKARALINQLTRPSRPDVVESSNGHRQIPVNDVFPIHTPVWVDTSTPKSAEPLRTISSLVVLCRAEADQVARLRRTLSGVAQRYLIVVVGAGSQDIVDQFDSPQIVAFDSENAQSQEGQLTAIENFHADAIVAFEAIETWDLAKSLHNVATDNALSEAMFLVAQRGVERLKVGQLQLWGLFVNGYDGNVHPTTGAIAGLLKSIDREFEESNAGVICTANRTVAQSFDCLMIELQSAQHEKEVVYDGEQRKVRRLRVATQAEPQPQFNLDSRSVVIATGGVRGVTAVLVEALLSDHQCTVVALGRTAPQPGPDDHASAEVERDYYTAFRRENPGATAAEMSRSFERACASWEVDRTIRRLASQGGRIEFKEVDITNHKQVAQAVDDIVSKYGRVDLIVHGAGVQYSKRLEHRSLQDFRRTYAVKLKGLHLLVENLARKFNRLIPTHILSSAYSVFGNDGQHDYGAANETLDRLCGLTGDGVPLWSSIAWLAWDGIGMTRGREYQALSKQRGLSGVNAEEGQRIFRDVIQGRSGANINVPISTSEHSRYAIATIPPSNRTQPSRVLEQSIELGATDWLEFHKVRQTPTLPGAWILDHLVSAAQQHHGEHGQGEWVTIRDVHFHRFVKCTDLDPNFRVITEEHADGSLATWLIGDLLHESGTLLSKDLVFAEANISFTQSQQDLTPALVPAENQNDLLSTRHYDDPYCRNGRADVQLSGPFDCIRNIDIGPNGRNAQIVATDFAKESTTFPALIFDAALRVGAMYAGYSGDELYVPVRIGRIISPVGHHAERLASAGCDVKTTAPHVEGTQAKWRRTDVFDKSGKACLVFEDATAKEMK